MSKLVAIIDDEVEMEFIYELMLEDLIQSEQISMKFFSDAREFVGWFQANPPDLILCDISMPHLNGTELGHRIRKAGLNIPTYFVSGHDERDYADSLKQLGVCRFLPKPININNFLHFLKTDLALKG